MKLLETLAFNYLLKHGYQITIPKIYFSMPGYDCWAGGTYWKPKVFKPITKSEASKTPRKRNKAQSGVSGDKIKSYNKET